MRCTECDEEADVGSGAAMKWPRVIHFALSPSRWCRVVSCGAHEVSPTTHNHTPQRRKLHRATMPAMVTCGNCRRTRRYREARLEAS